MGVRRNIVVLEAVIQKLNIMKIKKKPCLFKTISLFASLIIECLAFSSGQHSLH